MQQRHLLTPNVKPVIDWLLLRMDMTTFYLRVRAVLLPLCLYSTSGVAIDNDRFEIPKDKSALLACRSLALKEKMGTVSHQDIRKTPGGFHYLFEITTDGGAVWELTCDGTKKQIIETVKLTEP